MISLFWGRGGGDKGRFLDDDIRKKQGGEGETGRRRQESSTGKPALRGANGRGSESPSGMVFSMRYRNGKVDVQLAGAVTGSQCMDASCGLLCQQSSVQV